MYQGDIDLKKLWHDEQSPVKGVKQSQYFPSYQVVNMHPTMSCLSSEMPSFDLTIIFWMIPSDQGVQ